MNVGRYLRGEDRHVGTARTTQPQPPQRTEQEPVAHPERHELQAKGEHPAPCARHCEANAFQIVIKNLKAQLSQPEQEPVAWMDEEMTCIFFDAERPEPFDFDFWKPLYTTPPQRKPLTDEAISNIWCKVSNTDFVTVDTHEFARAIEAAHGIKENT